jgi:hypothetical protein
MRIFLILLFSALPTAYTLETGFRHTRSFQQLNKLMGRQIVTQCPAVAPGPDLCARSCGPGNISCFSYCYNPSAGESCCSDGSKSPLVPRLTDVMWLMQFSISLLPSRRGLYRWWMLPQGFTTFSLRCAKYHCYCYTACFFVFSGGFVKRIHDRCRANVLRE